MTPNKQPMPALVSALTPFPHTIASEATLVEAQQEMEHHEIRHLIVTQENDIYGLLSERDLKQHTARFDGNELTVGDICVSQAVVADLHDPLDQVLDAMAERHLGSVVVLREGSLVGIFTTTDACRYFARHLREHYDQLQTDDILA